MKVLARLLFLAFGVLLSMQSVNGQNTCGSPFVIPSIPFNSGAQTTCGTVNDYAAGFAPCVSSSYGGGEDYVYQLNVTTAPVSYIFSLGGAATWKILSLHSACPPAAANCLAGVANSAGVGSFNYSFASNGTYYLIVDTWPSPTCGAFTVDISVFVPPPGDNCSTAIDLGSMASPLSSTTIGTTNDFTNTCAGGNTSGDLVYFINVGAGQTLTIGQTVNGYDSENVISYGASCPSSGTGVSSVQIACFDDPDVQNVVWNNNTGSAQTVWWVQDGFSTANTGTFTLAWSVSCPVPTAPTTTAITSNSANLGWTGAGSNWEIEYGPFGFTQGTGTTVITSSSPYPLGGLAANSQYSWYVRQDCGGGSFSTWVGPTSFTTLAPPVVLTCPVNTTTASCQTQMAVDAAFSAWLATASGTGGCNGVLTNDNTGAPDACGGSTTVTFTYTSTCAPLTTTCQATFTVAAPPNMSISCPIPTTVAACQTQAAVDAQFATWLATVNGQGGCDYFLTDDAGGTAPSACGGSKTVAFIGHSSCAPFTITCTSTFTVAAPPTVVLTCPANATTPNGQSQVDVDAAFAAWLATASASGGCSGALTNDNTGAPSASGGSTTVTFTYTSTCAPLTTTCQATFTVLFPGPPNDLCDNAEAIPPASATICGTTIGAGADLPNGGADCINDADAFGEGVWYIFTGDGQTWDFYFPAGNDPEGSWDPEVNVYTGSCGSYTCETGNDDSNGTFDAAFSVNTVNGTTYYMYVHDASDSGGFYDFCFNVTVPNPPVSLTCPVNTTTAACQTQDAVNTEFAAWLATASGTGGCEGVLTNDNTGAPSACGGSTTVTFTYTSTCGDLVTTCQATFTVAAPPTMSISCPIPTTVAACQTQAAVDAQFAAWLATVNGQGGCGYFITDDAGGTAPSACGGSKTVTFIGHSSCAPFTITCTSTFTVTAPPTVVLTCPTPTTASACLTQAQLNAAYSAWLATASASGGCGGVLTNNSIGAPSICVLAGTTRTVTFTYTSTCAPLTTTCTSTFTVPAYPNFTVPANGAATVACPANATQPTPPAVVDGCGKALTPVGPTITNTPNPVSCEGTRTYSWNYTDCAGQLRTWSFIYTIERQPFTVPANGAATVACPANATQPVPPVVQSNCGETLTPTGPVITNSPNPLTCEGTRTYAWTYTDCEGNTATWSFVYTIERQPFTVPANGGATVACPAQTDTAPTPPVVTSNCGEVLTPVISISPKPICEGTRTYSYTYTDCEGNTAVWRYIYTVEYADFVVPASVVSSVECPVNATQPTPPTVADNCGNVLVPVGPVVTTTTNASGCEGSRKYEWTYKDCEGNTHTWSRTYNFLYTADFFAPLDEENYVTCLSYAVAPVPQALTDFCGQAIKVSGPVVEEEIAAGGCKGWRKFSYIYTDCGGHSHPWSFTYYIDDNEGPLGTCPNGSTNGAVSVNVSNLSCIEEVPCPDDYDFTSKIQELIENGNYYDVCSGGAISVTLDSYSDLWDCSDFDGNGTYTFGRTFYFLIADACGNKAASLCEITYSGTCLPLETFVQSDWGIAGGAPGNTVSENGTDIQVITTLIGNTPIVIGGGPRSLTISDPQCVVNLLPGIGGPSILANCHQLNCTGCNPLGIGGMKNALAANAIALTLNIRYNIQYNGMTLNAVRSQSLDCINISPNIVVCDAEGENCKLRVFDQQGVAYEYPYTIGGLLDLANFYLGGNVRTSIGQGVLYSTGLNESLQNVNAYWSRAQFIAQCGTDASVSPIGEGEKALQTGGDKNDLSFSLAPNPAGSEVTLLVSELVESQDVVFELYNSLGQLMLRKDFGRVSFVNERIDLAGIGNGLYIVSVKAGAQRYEQKLVVSKD